MFTSKISTLTDAEIASDIATCRTVLAEGHANTMELDADSKDYYRDWLAELAEEQTTRANPQDYETVSPVRRAA